MGKLQRQNIHFLLLVLCLGSIVEAHVRVSFYTKPKLKGEEYRLPRKWRDGCTNFPSWIDDGAKSIDLKGQCVVLCTEFDCEGRCVDVYPGIRRRWTSGSGENLDLNNVNVDMPPNGEGGGESKKTWFGDLEDIDMADQVSSVKPCW